MTEVPRPAFRGPVDPPPPGAPWTILHLLRWSARYLEEKGVPEPRLDAEHLLAHVLDVGRLDLYLQFERPLALDELERFKPLLLERSRRKPLQYVLGKAAFRDLELAVDPRVLIPRPETEELVGAVLDRVRGWGRTDLTAVDVGTGSGAIALSLASEGPFDRVVAIERSAEALRVAAANAAALGLRDRVELREGDLLDPLGEGERFHVVVSNPPYVGEREHRDLQPEVTRWEPVEALVAPDEGLGVLRRLVAGAPSHLEPGGILALEVGAGQAEAVAELVRRTEGLDAPAVLRDLSGRERLVLATRGERLLAPREGTPVEGRGSTVTGSSRGEESNQKGRVGR
jgi:release factor glutamine methyltransferase